MTSVPHPRAGTLSVVAVTLMGLGWSLFGVGCPTQPGASRPIAPPAPIPSSTFPIILTPTTDQTVTAGANVPLAYQIANPMEGVIVSAYLERADVGTQVATRSNLSTTGQTVELSTAGLAAGVYYPTVSLDNGVSRSVVRAKTAGGEDVAIQVRSGGAITFLAPTTSGPFAVGEEIPISFVLTNTTVPGEYRVFYDSDGVVNGNESPISVGRGTKADVVWRTDGLLPGVYFVGVTAESTGLSRTEYADTHIRLDVPPAILVTAPALDQRVGPMDVVNIRFRAADPDSDAHINVFVDQDGVFNGDELVVKADLDVTATSFALGTATLAPDVYFVGASLIPNDGVSPPEVDYARGKIEIIGGNLPAMALVSVSRCDTDPCSDVDVDRPLKNLLLGNADGLKVAWRAYDANSASVDMALYLDPDRFPLSGGELLLDERKGVAGPLAPGGETFSVVIERLTDLGVRPGQLYNYLMVIKDTDPNDAGPASIVRYAPVTLLITGRDTGVRWLGKVGQGIVGARIMGTAAGDQLGSVVLGVGDQNGDSRDDYLIAARFGNGGAGEAILAHGSIRRTVGTEVKPSGLGGVTFIGIPGGGSEGLADVVSLPDVDGDDAEEFVFAFPHVNGSAPDIMAAPGHFNAGGLVLVSSLNSALSGSGGFLGGGSISLNRVGRNFNCDDGKPCLGRGSAATCNVLWTPNTDPRGDCFAPPLTLVDCNPVETPACPCLTPGVFPGMWPGGEVDDGFSEDDLQQGQLEPYGARILGTQALPARLLIDCNNDAQPDSPATYLSDTQVFDAAGRFGSALGGPGASAFGGSGSLVVTDPSEGNSGTIYRISPRNWWKSRLETSSGICIWGTPKPFPENPDFPAPCVDVMDFSVPRPHQYRVGGGGVSFSAIRGPAGSELTTVVEWRIDSDVLADVVVGAPGDDEGTAVDAGALYMLLGKDLGGDVNVDEVFEDNSAPLGTGSIRGTKIVGAGGERLGEVEPLVGDFDGDNRPDLVVGIPRYCDRDENGVCEEDVGAVLVIFGGLDLDGNGRIDLVERPDPRTNPWTIPELLQENLAILIKGERDENDVGLGCPDVDVDRHFWAGYAIASPGDVDGDFLDDIMVSAPGADHDFATVLTEEATAGVGSIFVASDEGITVGADIRISTPAVPAGFECRTVRAINRLPDALTGQIVFQLKLKDPLAFDHLLVDGQQEVTVRLIDAGKVFVFYGRRDLRLPVGLDANVFQDRVYAMTTTASLKLGSTIYVGRRSNSYVGGRESLDVQGLGWRKFFTAAGDVDGDGAVDLLIASPGASPFNRTKAGEVYLIYTNQ